MGKTCGQCRHLVDFPDKYPHRLIAQSFRWCQKLEVGRYPMQDRDCAEFEGKGEVILIDK